MAQLLGSFDRNMFDATKAAKAALSLNRGKDWRPVRIEEEENTPQGYQGIGGYKLGGGPLGMQQTYNVPSTSGSVGSTGSSGGRKSGGGSSVGGYYEEGPSLYDQYLAQLEAERQKRIAAIKDSIRAQVEQTVRGYESQRPDIQNNYQGLKNQSEVERYNQARMLRESQANRGALDSGAGRQENLAMQNNYGNALNSIQQAEQKDLNELNRAIEDAKSQGSMQMALAEIDDMGNYSAALQAPEQLTNTANYASARSGIRKASRGGSRVASETGTGLNAGMSTINNAIMNNNLSKKLQDQLKKRKYNQDDYSRLGGMGTTR